MYRILLTIYIHQSSPDILTKISDRGNIIYSINEKTLLKYLKYLDKNFIHENWIFSDIFYPSTNQTKQISVFSENIFKQLSSNVDMRDSLNPANNTQQILKTGVNGGKSD